MDPEQVVKVEGVDIKDDTFATKQALPDRPTQWRVKKPFNPVRSTISMLLRLFVWYSLFTAVFRCPASISELNDDSPRVCKPYLVSRTHLDPLIAPLYHRYAEPYVSKIQPYTDSFYRDVYTPTAHFSKHVYHGYAAEYVEKGVDLAKEQWVQRVSPHIDPLQKQVTDYYAASVEPHVKSVQSTVVPYLHVAASRSVHIKDNYLVPSYIRAKPVVIKVYVTVRHFVDTKIAPYAWRIWAAICTFVNGTVRTHIVHLYSENVEPQLVKIGEKLASYREGRTIQHVNLETSSSITESGPTGDSKAKRPTESRATYLSPPAESPTTTTKLTPAQRTQEARDIISADLKTWKKKSRALAEEGRRHVQQQAQDAVAKIYNHHKPTAESLLDSLEEVVELELRGLRHGLSEIVQSIPTQYTQEDEDKAQDELLKLLKSSSLAIREAAHSVRVWFNQYTDTLNTTVLNAINATLEVLEYSPNLALQDIGMRWARMEHGVTYDDWAKFYELKAELTHWKDEVRVFVMQDSAYVSAKAFADNIVAAGMDIAQDAAQQLSELKAIGSLKIEAGESSGDFDVTHITPEMIEERRRSSMITGSITTPIATSTPSGGHDDSSLYTSGDTNVVQAISETSAPVESLEAEVETPHVENHGEQPKAALFDEESSTLVFEDPDIEPSPEELIPDPTQTIETPSAPSPDPTSTELSDGEATSSPTSELLKSDLSDAGPLPVEEVIGSLGQAPIQQMAAVGYHEIIGSESEQSSLKAESISPSSTHSSASTFMTQRFDEPVDVDSKESGAIPSPDPVSESSSALTPLMEAIGADEIIGSATDEFSSLVSSAKAGLERNTLLPSDEAHLLIENASTKLDEVLSSAQSSLASIEEPSTIPSASATATPEEKPREFIDSEIERLKAALQDAQARLSELNKAGGAVVDIPESESESESQSTAPNAPSSAHLLR